MNLKAKKHLLDIDSYSKEEILQILNDSKIMMEILNRRVKKIPTLRGKTIVTLFYEPSTRTRISFEQAAKILNADVINISTNDYDSSSINIPITLNVTDVCGQWNIGDANLDSQLNVQDVIIMLNIVLDSSSYDDCQIFVSDLNEDGQINIQDIILLVNIILS